FHRALAGQLEGGQVFSVNLDGSDLQALGTDVAGDLLPPADQDFEAITPACRVIFEAEFESLLDTRLLSTTSRSAQSLNITTASAPTRTVDPRDENFAAFESRFASTCTIRSRSALTHSGATGSAAASTSNPTPYCSPYAPFASIASVTSSRTSARSKRKSITP